MQNSTDGFQIIVHIHDLKLDCLIDTGASISVLHPSQYYALPEDLRPKLRQDCGNLRMAVGGQVIPVGHAKFPLTINGIVEHSLIVADVEAPLVIGFDFMREQRCILDIGRGILTFKGEQIQCTHDAADPARVTSRDLKITMLDTVIVPPASEMIVGGKIDMGDINSPDVLVEPCDSKLLSKSILVARSLVRPVNGEIPLRIINLSDSPQQIYQNTHAATGEIVEVTNFQQSTEGHVRVINSASQNIPPHLETLWNKACSELNNGEKQFKRFAYSIPRCFR